MDEVQIKAAFKFLCMFESGEKVDYISDEESEELEALIEDMGRMVDEL